MMMMYWHTHSVFLCLALSRTMSIRFLYGISALSLCMFLSVCASVKLQALVYDRHPLEELRCQKAMLGVLVPGLSQSLRLFRAVRLCCSRDVKTPRPPPPPNSLCWQNDVPVS